ncbi:MAG: shikimate kinase [Candidatus Omnitrophota bacterium]
MKNVVLFGFMGTGKSVVGREVAGRLKYQFVDTDELIEKSEDTTINAIFKRFGESYFREREKEAVNKLKDIENIVIATGGGAVLFQENIDNLKKKGVLIYLTATPHVIYKRLQQMNDRPLLNVDNPEEKINMLLKFREPFYKKVTYTIDTSDLQIEEVVEKVLEIYAKATKET